MFKKPNIHMIIREASNEDWDSIWTFFKQIVEAGDTYAYDPKISKPNAKRIWFESPQKTYVCISDGIVQGSYFIKPNYLGPGSHVCNCGYMVSSGARGKGLATKMCEHSQRVALEFGYKAMQYNIVAANNTAALHLWKKHGFIEVGRVPKGFKHPDDGYVDALVMHKWLAPRSSH